MTRRPTGKALWLIGCIASVPDVECEEIALGEAADFVGGDMDSGGGVGAGAERGGAGRNRAEQGGTVRGGGVCILLGRR